MKVICYSCQVEMKTNGGITIAHANHTNLAQNGLRMVCPYCDSEVIVDLDKEKRTTKTPKFIVEDCMSEELLNKIKYDGKDF